MSIKKRKIAFHAITIKDQKGNKAISCEALFKSITNVQNLGRADVARQQNVLSSNKFHLLDSFERVGKKSLFLIFKTAKYNHCPPLLDTNTLKERDSNKKPDEGESEKTHIAIKFKDDEAIMILEERQAGIPIKSIIEIFEKLLKKAHESKIVDKLYSICDSIIAADNFEDEFKKLNKVKIGELYVQKQILGSSQLNFSNSLDHVNEHLVITVRAKRNLSIVDTIKEVYSKFISARSEIKKIRIHGVNRSKNEVCIDTEFLKKVDYMEVPLDQLTKVVDSDLMKKGMMQILDNL